MGQWPDDQNDRVGTITEIKRDMKEMFMKMYKVLIHNDDKNDMMHVARTLIEIFKMDAEKAAKVMLEAHNTGVGLCAVEPLEHAELHMEQLRAKSLSSTIEAD